MPFLGLQCACRFVLKGLFLLVYVQIFERVRSVPACVGRDCAPIGVYLVVIEMVYRVLRVGQPETVAAGF